MGKRGNQRRASAIPVEQMSQSRRLNRSCQQLQRTIQMLITIKASVLVRRSFYWNFLLCSESRDMGLSLSCNGAHWVSRIIMLEPQTVVVLSYRNSGNSMALHVVARAKLLASNQLRVGDDRSKLVPKNADCNHVEKGGAPVLPNGELPGFAWQTFDKSTTEDLITGARGFYLVGCIDYMDQTGHPYRTDFCLYYVSRLAPNLPSGYLFPYCAKGNSAS
jgi:hypothetical protein